jgi:hypothetical protein
MAMPETPMHKNRDTILTEHNVWAAGQISAMQSKPVPQTVKQLAQQ